MLPRQCHRLAPILSLILISYIHHLYTYIHLHTLNLNCTVTCRVNKYSLLFTSIYVCTFAQIYMLRYTVQSPNSLHLKQIMCISSISLYIDRYSYIDIYVYKYTIGIYTYSCITYSRNATQQVVKSIGHGPQSLITGNRPHIRKSRCIEMRCSSIDYGCSTYIWNNHHNHLQIHYAYIQLHFRYEICTSRTKIF